MTSVVVSSGRLRMLDGDVPGEPHDGGQMTALATRDGTTWYAVVDHHVVLRGAPTATWSVVAEAEDAGITCLLETSVGLFAGTEGAHLLRLDGKTLVPVASFEHAPGRTGWYTPWGGPPAVRTLSEAADGTLYVNVHVGGIVRSRDAGLTWHPTIDIDTDVHQVLVHRASGVVFAACGVGGLATSTDGGDHWAIDADGLHGQYCRAVAVSGRTVLVSASTGPGSRRGALYRRSLSGGQFERCEAGLPEWFAGNIDSGWLDADDQRCLFAEPDGRVYESVDEGRSWTEVAHGLRDVRAVISSADAG